MSDQHLNRKRVHEIVDHLLDGGGVIDKVDLDDIFKGEVLYFGNLNLEGFRDIFKHPKNWQIVQRPMVYVYEVELGGEWKRACVLSDHFKLGESYDDFLARAYPVSKVRKVCESPIPEVESNETD